MKKIEAFYSVLSFLIAIVVGGLVMMDLLLEALVVSWAGTLLTALAYVVTARTLRPATPETE